MSKEDGFYLRISEAKKFSQLGVVHTNMFIANDEKTQLPEDFAKLQTLCNAAIITRMLELLSHYEKRKGER